MFGDRRRAQNCRVSEFWTYCCTLPGFGVVHGGVVLFDVCVGNSVVVIPRRWPCRCSSSGFGFISIVMVCLGVGIWNRERRWGAALVWRWDKCRSKPLVVIFAWRRGAAAGTAGMALGFGVGVCLGVVVRRWGFS